MPTLEWESEKFCCLLSTNSALHRLLGMDDRRKKSYGKMRKWRKNSCWNFSKFRCLACWQTAFPACITTFYATREVFTAQKEEKIHLIYNACHKSTQLFCGSLPSLIWLCESVSVCSFGLGGGSLKTYANTSRTITLRGEGKY